MRPAFLTAALLAASLLLTAAGPVWRWSVPAGVSAPAVPSDNPMTAAKVELGRRLFHDADLSINGTMSCATCHEQEHAFADGNATHAGATGVPGRRNVPGLANAAWLSPLGLTDTSAVTLELQVHTPVFGTGPTEMGMAGQEAAIGERLGADRCYRAMFRRAFPETGGRVDFGNVARALASFQRTFVSFGSAYDRGALSANARAGKALFDRDCAACHSGPLLTDLEMHRVEPADEAASDPGLFEHTGLADDRGRFRTPSLRNVALTGPWWHDGSAPTLEQAISRHRPVSDPAQMAGLTAFLSALSDTEFTTRETLSRPDRACGRRL